HPLGIGRSKGRFRRFHQRRRWRNPWPEPCQAPSGDEGQPSTSWSPIRFATSTNGGSLMRTRKLMASAAFMALGLGATQANAQILMKGSDTLEDVAKDAIAAAGLTASITYVGGGSGTGQAAMTSTPPTQQMAPMSRQLNGSACTTLGATTGQLLIGLDGIALVGANQTGG